jgi:hypothetical protein
MKETRKRLKLKEILCEIIFLIQSKNEFPGLMWNNEEKYEKK